MIPANIKAICLDAVGTMIFPEPSAADVYAEVGERLGSQYDAATVRDRFHRALAEEENWDYAHNWQTSESREFRRWRQIITSVLDDVADAEECFRLLYGHFRQSSAWRTPADLAEVVPSLMERGYQLAIASNFDHRLNQVLSELPPLDQINHVFISSQIGWRKPSPRFFEAVCRGLELAPKEILMVGDDVKNDIDGARAAGFPCLLVDHDSEGKGLAQLVD